MRPTPGDSGRAAWTAAAMEPRGGIRASISRPSLTSALAMETTTLPARGSRSARTVATGAVPGRGHDHELGLGRAGVVRTRISASVLPGQLPPTSATTPAARSGVARADRHLDAGSASRSRDAAAGRSRSPEDSHVHGPTFA